MLALPAAPPPVPRRQLLVGTSLACGAAAMMFGGMLAIYLRLRMSAINTVDVSTGEATTWIPSGLEVPMVAANNMLISFLGVVVFAQWAVYAARRNQRTYTGLAVGLTALLGVAVVNAQAYIYQQMEVPVRGGPFNVLFYALTGTFVVLMAVGITFSIVTAFRYLGGRTSDREIVAAHALYWYFMAALFSALWFVVYVTK